MKKNRLGIPAAGSQQKAGQQEQAQKRQKPSARGPEIESLVQIDPPWPAFPSAADADPEETGNVRAVLFCESQSQKNRPDCRQNRARLIAI